MSLFDVNRLSFLKIFETHQFRGQLTFADFLNIAKSLKICPDLIPSLELESLFRSSAVGSRLTLVEFEELVKKLALKINNQGSQDAFKQFLEHLKTPALNSYGIQLKTGSIKAGPKPAKLFTSSSRPMILKNHVNNKSISFKSAKTARGKNLQQSKRKSCFDLLHSGIVEYKEVSMNSRRPSKADFLSKPDSGEVKSRLKSLTESLKTSLKQDSCALQPRKLKTCLTINNLSQTLTTSARLSFLLWKLLI
jgi:hypothetical protein